MRDEKGRFIKGHNPWDKGIKLSFKHKKKISKAHIGKSHSPHSEETKRKIGLANSISKLGTKYTEEHKQKISKALKGKKRSPLSEEHKIKLSLAKIGKYKGENSPAWKGGKPKCSDCRKQLSTYNNKKCSEHKGLRGENSPNWKGGLRGEDYLARRRFRNQMQKLVFARDNFTCQICGARGNLQVDHIQSWAEYVELRFSMDNCRTLCMDCHYSITFGKPKPKDIVWGHDFKKARILP